MTPVKTTRSLCPRCSRVLEARVEERDGAVFLDKTCPEHGAFTVRIATDSRFHYRSVGSGQGEGCGTACGCHGEPDANGGLVSLGGSAPARSPETPPPSFADASSTCIALIEIVTSCNLTCPTCYADSPFRTTHHAQSLSPEEFDHRLGAVLARKGEIDILQLSGGEPTIHPDFFTLLERAWDDERIGYLLLNTNGVRLARDTAFAARLGAMYRDRRGLEVYLQFDGPQLEGQTALRGADLRRVREQAIAACAEHGIPVTLAMTVNDDTLPFLGDTLRFGLERPNVRGITFQPMFLSGRHTGREAHPLNVADLILGLVGQSGGLLSERDFTPLPCGDPNCHTVGYLLRRGDRVQSVSELLDFTALQGFLQDRVDFRLEDLEQCGCESEPLGEVLRELEIGPDDVFRLFLKPFMDVWTYDQDRIDRCCVHVIGEGGSLDSFCRHYALRAG